MHNVIPSNVIPLERQERVQIDNFLIEIVGADSESEVGAEIQISYYL